MMYPKEGANNLDTVLTGGYVSILYTGMFESALCIGHVTINCGVVVSILFLSIQIVSYS